MDHSHARLQVLGVLMAIALFPTLGFAQATCVAPDLSDRQIKDIIEKERATRSDLPAPLPQSKWSVRRQGCYYVYSEYAIPESFDTQRVIKLNQRGVIVDVQVGTSDTSTLKCPERVFTESELAAVVREARTKRRDLPRPFPNSRIRVDQIRCLYLYFEYAIPERRGDFQIFTIDPFGELMEFSRSQPY